jgi:hypothetical protein
MMRAKIWAGAKASAAAVLTALRRCRTRWRNRPVLMSWKAGCLRSPQSDGYYQPLGSNYFPNITLTIGRDEGSFL